MNTGRNHLTRSLMVLQYYPMRWGMKGESHWHILGAGLGGGELHGGNVSLSKRLQ
jgi:hypothetical protein